MLASLFILCCPSLTLGYPSSCPFARVNPIVPFVQKKNPIIPIQSYRSGLKSNQHLNRIVMKMVRKNSWKRDGQMEVVVSNFVIRIYMVLFHCHMLLEIVQSLFEMVITYKHVSLDEDASCRRTFSTAQS
jgi:hypothetical protein